MSRDISLEPHLSVAALTAHVEKHYSLKAKTLTALDLNVYRVDTERSVLVARVFPQESASSVILKVAELLGHVSQHAFPAEQCFEAGGTSVSTLDGREGCVLLTHFVDGKRPERNKVTFYRLGRLHGRLARIPIPDGTPTGGAWHHITLGGGIKEETAAAIELLDRVTSTRVGGEAGKQHVKRLQDELQRIHAMPMNDLPKGIIHPDLVPANIIAQEVDGDAHDKWTVIDWAGAGVGPRILTLSFLLAVASARGSLGLIKAVVKGYLASGAGLEACELDDRLPTCIYARLLVIHCWEVVTGRRTAAETVDNLPYLEDMGLRVSKRTREILASS